MEPAIRIYPARGGHLTLFSDVGNRSYTETFRKKYAEIFAQENNR